MEAVWNIVWWRRVVYFLTLFSSLYLVALPLFAETLSTKQTLQLRDGLAGGLSQTNINDRRIHGAGLVWKTWLDTFAEEPVLFLVRLLSVAATIS